MRSVYLLWFELLLLVCLLVLSEVLDFTVPLSHVCICVCVSSGCKAEHQIMAHCGSSNRACGECHNLGYYGHYTHTHTDTVLYTHTHTQIHTVLKFIDPKHDTHTRCSHFPTTHTDCNSHKIVQSCCCLILPCDLVQARKCSTGEENDWIIRRDWVWVGDRIG